MNGDLRAEVNRTLQDTDSLMDALERRIAALEEVAATRWPARILARRRLRRRLAAAMAGYSGESFYWRRAESASAEWLLSFPQPGRAGATGPDQGKGP